jgi:hypothetical protein
MLAPMRKSSRGVIGCGFSVLAFVGGCGDDSSAVPFDSIPKDKRLVDLSPEEVQGTCQWGQDLARQKLAPGGAPVTCNGNQINFNGCNVPSPSQVDCTATVGQWEACIPNFLDRIAQDPCQVLSLSFSQTELERFVNETPGCAGLGPCAYTIRN